ncbi:MAG: PIN domain-containing protein [Desulfamplus sp.]|nr:PIN domain-containing protein [Desulfamplus sp.]
MTEKIFIDTNILVYAFLENDKAKHNRSKQLFSEIIGKEVFISIQVISEIYSALSKNGIVHEAISEYIYELEKDINVCPINFSIITKCLFLKKRYGYSYWDSLILASSLESGCEIIYSEDMQHGQVIEKKIKIINPYL